jgi:hypothetical protein
MQNPYQPPGAPRPGWGPPPAPGWPQTGAPFPPGGVPFGSASAYPMTPEQREQARLRAVEGEIQDQANAGLLGACVGLFCFLGVIGGPIAMYRANKALRLIRENGVGAHHAGKAKAALALGGLSILTFVAALGVIIFIGARSR